MWSIRVAGGGRSQRRTKLAAAVPTPHPRSPQTPMTSPALVLVTGHRSSAAAGRQALHPHMDPRPHPSPYPSPNPSPHRSPHPSCPCKILSPTLNNSARSRSLPPEGLVSWRHQWDDLTAPERSGVFFFFFSFTHPSPQPPFTHPPMPHTHTNKARFDPYVTALRFPTPSEQAVASPADKCGLLTFRAPSTSTRAQVRTHTQTHTHTHR